MKSKILNIILASLLGFITTSGLLILFNLIGLLDPFTALNDVLDANNIDLTGEPSSLGFWFSFWNLLTFAPLSSYGLINFDIFTIDYLLLLLGFLLGFLVIGLVSSSKVNLLISVGVFYIINILISILSAFLLSQNLYIGALPPEQQESTKSIWLDMALLSILLPFLSLIIYFVVNLGLGISLAFIGYKLKSKE